MTDAFEEFKTAMAESEISANDLVDTDIVGKLGEEIDKKFILEEEIANLTAELEAKQNELKEFDRVKIPQLVEAAGLSEVTTKNGFKITIKNEYRGNISEANANIALDWFIKSGGADTIKNNYVIPISINDKEVAQKLEDILSKCGIDFSRKINIAWNTLAGVIKELDVEGKLETNEAFEMLKKEKGLDPELTLSKVLGAYKYKTTKVQKPKKK